MSLIINTLDVEKLIKYGFYYTKTYDNKYHKLELKYGNSDFVTLKAEWVKDEKTALLEIEAEICEDFCYITLDIPNVIYNLINEGLLRKG